MFEPLIYDPGLSGSIRSLLAWLFDLVIIL